MYAILWFYSEVCLTSIKALLFGCEIDKCGKEDVDTRCFFKLILFYYKVKANLFTTRFTDLDMFCYYWSSPVTLSYLLVNTKVEWKNCMPFRQKALM